jgi:hypothetical protein
MHKETLKVTFGVPVGLTIDFMVEAMHMQLALGRGNGPVQEYGGCADRAAPFSDVGSSSDPRDHKLMIWGRGFDFDESGQVWDNNMDRFAPGGINAPPYAPIRRIGLMSFPFPINSP